MKVKIIIQSRDKETGYRITSELWSGELDIQTEKEHVVKVTMIGEGEPRPLADIPFAIGVGHYVWMPASNAMDDTDDGWAFPE